MSPQYFDTSLACGRRVVTIGGGTGQPRVIRALRELGCTIDAIVTVADDGRSSGALRRETGMLPPGDIRRCLGALAADPDGLLARSLERRLPFACNHAMGNLLLTTLALQSSSYTEAIAEAERALACVGHVHPATLTCVCLAGKTVSGDTINGQWELSHAPEALERVWLEPDAPAACEGALRAIEKADAIVFSPGSLFTSLIPNLLVPQIADAVSASCAKKIFVCPKADVQGETRGMDAVEYLDALERHGLACSVDAMLVHVEGMTRGDVRSQRAISDEDLERLRLRAGRVICADFTDSEHAEWHSPAVLGAVLAEVLA